MKKRKITVYTDGASRGNPGLAAVGAVIFDGEEVVAEIREFLGKQTNNWAEYEAVYMALKKALKLGLNNRDIEVRLDSKLVAEQLSGNWKIKSDSIRKQYNKVQDILKNGFLSIKYTHIPREKNKYADRLANEAIDMR